MSHKRRRGWTVKTLKDYVDQRFKDSDKAVLAALDAAQKGLERVDQNTERQFSGVNTKIDNLQTSVNQNLGGQSTGQRAWAIAIPTLMSAVAIIVVLVTRH